MRPAHGELLQKWGQWLVGSRQKLRASRVTESKRKLATNGRVKACAIRGKIFIWRSFGVRSVEPCARSRGTPGNMDSMGIQGVDAIW